MKRHGPDSRSGKQKSQGSLQGERSAYVTLFRYLADDGRKLGGIGNHGNPPNNGYEQKKQRMMKHQSRNHAADCAYRHSDNRDFRALANSGGLGGRLQAITDDPGPEAANRADTNHQGCSRFGLRPGPAAGSGQYDGDPSPHGIEFPHVSEVAEVGQAQAAVPGDLPNL